MAELGDQFKLYRGEVRRAFPSPEYPDPAAAVREDPHGFMTDWMRHSYPYPEGYHGMNLSVGQHWTRSPQTIPERFVEPVLLHPQPGIPLGKQEATGISRRTRVDLAYHEEPKLPEDYWKSEDWRSMQAEHTAKVEEHRATIRKYESYLQRAEREGRNTYRDLSGGDPDRPGKARPYKMAVVWEGHAPEHETGTNYEDELNLPHESTVHITGARIHIPSAGEVHDFTRRYPSPFTPEEMHRARHDVITRSTYSHIDPESSVPWSRVQFAGAVEVPVKHHQTIRYGR